MTRLLLTGLEGPPNGRRSRADMGLAARAALGFPVIGAFFDTGLVHGPQRPAVIAERFACPSCDAPPGEACHLNALQSAIQKLQHTKTVNDELLKTQEATLQQLDEMQKQAEQLKIFSKRG